MPATSPPSRKISVEAGCRARMDSSVASEATWCAISFAAMTRAAGKSSAMAVAKPRLGGAPRIRAVYVSALTNQKFDLGIAGSVEVVLSGGAMRRFDDIHRPAMLRRCLELGT